MSDDMLERLALDLLASELKISLDIGRDHRREFMTFGQSTRQKVVYGRLMLLDRGRGKSSSIGQVPEVVLA